MNSLKTVDMSVREKASVMHKIERKWVKEESRTFTEYPGTPGVDFVGDMETWVELAQFYVEDLRWLLSLEHHKFWSHMVYSEKAHELLVSFLKEFPPNYMKNNLVIEEDMKNIFKEMEHLVFLIFVRLSTEKESESCFIRNLGEIIYNNYLFTVPIILDICLIYGTSNGSLVKDMINNVIMLAPNFLDDFQEIIPYFVHVLKTVKDKFSPEHLLKLKTKPDLRTNQIQDVVLYLCDSVATIQRFFDLYPNISRFFPKAEFIAEIVLFYSSVLPEMEKHCVTTSQQNTSFNLCDLLQHVRIDMLKIVKSVFDFVTNETSEVIDKVHMVDEYLTLMTELLSEPLFFHDYNLIYSVEFELESAVRNCHNIDAVKLNHVREGVASLVSCQGSALTEELRDREPEANVRNLVREVKGIFPHMEDRTIECCLKYCNNNMERVIAGILENSIPAEVFSSERKVEEADEAEKLQEFRGKHRSKHKDVNEMLNDKEEINTIKGKFTELSYVADDTYDDEYDDTYDENIDVAVKEGDEMGRRAFVVPRVLRGTEEEEEQEEEGETRDREEEEEEQEKEGRDWFVENPAVVRERWEQKRAEREKRDVGGRGRGRGQSKEVMRNRGFKEAHKSSVGNHNRKKQASRKLSRGMIPS